MAFNKRVLLLLSLLGFGLWCFSQAKKPTLMVVPSDMYCQQHGYMLSFSNDGQIEMVPDYKAALQNDFELATAITTMGQIMADRGFPLKLLEQQIKSLTDEQAEDALLTSKSGSDIAETPIDKLRKKAKCDIILQINWKINRTGPRSSVTFNLQGIDPYTNKQVAASQCTGEPSYSTELPVLIEEAVINNLETFNNQLQSHFNDMFTNGIEIAVRIKKWEDSEFDLESEFDGLELGEIIEDWMADNAVQGRFSTTDATENMMYFEQVRIPLYDEKGRANDARRWCRGLVSMLTNLGVPAKLMTKGLGMATIVIGGK